MLETDLFWTFITILSTVIEWIVLRFLLEEISKLKKSKIQLNTYETQSFQFTTPKIYICLSAKQVSEASLR